MTNPYFLDLAVTDILAKQTGLSEFTAPAVKLLATNCFQKALAEAYRQHEEFLNCWFIGHIHPVDYELLYVEHRKRIENLFAILGVGDTTITLLIDSEFATKPLKMRLPQDVG